MKRLVALVLGLLVVMGGVAAAASGLKVTINGREITFTTPPQVVNNVVMVPLQEVAQSLGIEGKLNLQTNTLEITDTRAQRIAQLEGRVKELEEKLTPPKPVINSETLLTELQSRYGTFKGAKPFTVNWSRNPYSTDSSPLYVAEMNSAEYSTLLSLRVAGEDKTVLDWFDGAAKLIAQVYPKSASAVLVFHGTYSTYPSAHYSRVDYTSGGKWAITDYQIWSFITNGQARTSWED